VRCPKRTMSTALLALALALPAIAQQPPAEGGGPGRGRDEVFRMVDAYIVSNLQESLGLDDAGFVRLLPVVKRLQTERRQALRARLETLSELRRLMREGGATESRVVELMKQVKQQEAEAAQQQRANVEAIDAQLTPVQQAKFRILEFEVEQRLRRLLEQARPQQPGNPGRRPRGARPGE
jgi:hypothetical protein